MNALAICPNTTCEFILFEKPRKLKKEYPRCGHKAAYKILGPHGYYLYCEKHWNEMYESFNDSGKQDWTSKSERLP